VLSVRDVKIHRTLSLGHLADASLSAVLALAQSIHAEFLQLASQGVFILAPRTRRAIGFPDVAQ
jgi:hypothetical protein